MKSLESGSSSKTILALLDRELHKANINVTLQQKLIDDTHNVHTAIHKISKLHEYVKHALEELNALVELIDERTGSQYAAWFKSKLLTQPVSQVDLAALKARLLNMPNKASMAGPFKLLAVAEEAAFELDLRLMMHGLVEAKTGSPGPLGGVMCGRVREFPEAVKIYEDCAIEGRTPFKYFFIYAPVQLVQDLPGGTEVREDEVMVKAELWTRPWRPDAVEAVVKVGEAQEEECGRPNAVFIDFDLKSLLANERTFLSWTNAATGVATAGAYLGNWVFLLTGLGFVWLALVLFILRRRSINQDKVGLVVRSPWFATLFASFVLAVVVLRITKY